MPAETDERAKPAHLTFVSYPNRFVYPLTVPIVRPLIRYLCPKNVKSTIGIIIIVPQAHTTSH
jgi:hypothetical protein